MFDLDDTLYPEHQFVRCGFRAAAGLLNRLYDPHADYLSAMLADFDAGHRGDIFNRVLRRWGLPESSDDITQLVSAYRQCDCRGQLTLHDDADRALTRLHGRAHLGVITDGYLHVQRNKAAALKLHERIEHIICTDQWGRSAWKPSPVAFEYLMTQYACPPASYVYVGDNVSKDFVAPNALGWHTVHIDRAGGEYAGKACPDGGMPARQISSLDELDNVLPRHE